MSKYAKNVKINSTNIENHSQVRFVAMFYRLAEPLELAIVN